MSADDVSEYLRADKTASGPLIWKSKGHRDYSEAVKIILCASLPDMVGQLRLTAHKSRNPVKYGFTLLVGSGRLVRVLGLDVNPASSHFNVRTMESINSTHWQVFPDYEAVVDDRSLTHLEWFDLFLERGKIASSIRYKAPPREDAQMSML